MDYERRYTDDTHGMAEPASVLPRASEPRLEVEQVGGERPDPFADAKAAVEREDQITDEEKEAAQTLYECERQAIQFECQRMMRLAVSLLSDLSKRRDFPMDLSGYELLVAQCRMLDTHGYTEDALLQLHHVMFPDSHLFWPMKRFPKRFRSRGRPTNVVLLDAYRDAGVPPPRPPAA